MTNKTLPDGWQWKTIKDIILDCQAGLVRTVSEVFEDNIGYYYIKMNNLSNSGKIVFDKIFYTKANQAEVLKYSLIKYDILFNVRNSYDLVGKFGIYTNDYENVIYNHMLLRIRANKNEVFPFFLIYSMMGKYFQNELNKIKKGTTNIVAIYQGDLLKIEIPLPSLEEQKRIVAKIDAAFEQLDEAISLQKNNILRTETLKKALLVEQFSELPYEKKELGEISKLGTGATPLTSNKTYYENGNIVWITSSSTNEPFVKTPEKFITEKALNETNCKTYPVGTLIIALYGQGKTRGQITELCIEAATNQACAAIVLNDKSLSHRKYVKYFFLMSYTKLREMSSGGTQENLNLNKIKTTKIPLPPLTEQEKIVAFLDKSFAEIDAMLEAQKIRLAHLEGMKKAILQEAFEGKI